MGGRSGCGGGRSGCDAREEWLWREGGVAVVCGRSGCGTREEWLWYEGGVTAVEGEESLYETDGEGTGQAGHGVGVPREKRRGDRAIGRREGLRYEEGCGIDGRHSFYSIL